MQYPVNFIGITKPFKKGTNAHYGVDFGWNSTYGGKNQEILAVDDGTVVYVEKQTTGGNTIHIRHSSGFTSEYGHLSKFLVKKGDKVKQGQVIGLMGNTGNSNGYHLHFGLFHGVPLNYKDKGKFVDPLLYLCRHKNQKLANSTKSKYKILETMTVVGVPSEPLNVRDQTNKVVGHLYNGDEVEFFGYKLLSGKAIVDKTRTYTTLYKYLK